MRGEDEAGTSASEGWVGSMTGSDGEGWLAEVGGIDGDG